MASTLLRLSRTAMQNTQHSRSLTLTACVFERKTLKPYDRRFPLSPKDISEFKPGGNKDICKMVGRTGLMSPQHPGYYTESGNFVFIPEMVPEFVVPDLKEFKLKPYVSYKVTDIKQSEFTAKDLFDSLYGKKIVDDWKVGKLDKTNPVESLETYTKRSSS